MDNESIRELRSAAECAGLSMEFAELLADAERYRWLRDCRVSFTHSESMPFPRNNICGQPLVRETTAFGVRGTLDAAIDAAMTGKT